MVKLEIKTHMEMIRSRQEDNLNKAGEFPALFDLWETDILGIAMKCVVIHSYHKNNTGFTTSPRKAKIPMGCHCKL